MAVEAVTIYFNKFKDGPASEITAKQHSRTVQIYINPFCNLCVYCLSPGFDFLVTQLMNSMLSNQNTYQSYTGTSNRDFVSTQE